MKRPIRRMIHLLNHTGTIKVFFAYVIVLCIGAVLTWIFEPQVQSLWDGFWFCFVASTTIGFGDITAVTVIGRLVVIFVTLCGILTVAMVPGVVVAYYTEYLRKREEDTVSTFLEKLEHLPELQKKELEEISERIKNFNKKRK
ncbi:potassium channel family protein [Ruminococcus sp.]|uniref:potassium channel family protein n=1 Tax=Ruminococcus sp. TaxID=41978 RepID=UPI002931D033|nr:potassium channel family protein [Ruminococcus sp.]MEE1264142.1 potassium channel family protein [Ruminococcus sp.]MEE3475491.1 potassium channel family protein [Ruminococcus sp.]